MNIELAHSIPKLRSLPGSLPLEGAIRIELEEGVPILRASSLVQKLVDTLLLAGVSRATFLLECRRYSAASVEWDQAEIDAEFADMDT